MARVVVIGAGIMGLSAAYQALLNGHEVTLFEAAPLAGGMAAHFQLGDISIERFYHFVCKTDEPTFELLRELGMLDKLRWVDTSMGYFIGGRLHDWGDPWALLRFPFLTLPQKIRYGILAYVSTRRNRWDSLEQKTARDWITVWCGPVVYDRMWRSLFDQKMHQHADNISAAWIWTRIRRLGRSRRNLFQEQLGYIENGSETLVGALACKIKSLGGKLSLATPVTKVCCAEGRVTGVEVRGSFCPADAVICTVPTPLVATLVPDLQKQEVRAYQAIVNIGVVCVVLNLRQRVSSHFWININEPDIDVPGIIEFSNLRSLPSSVIYIPYYLPVTHAKWGWSDMDFLENAMACLRRVNPDLPADVLIRSQVSRLRHAQPICPPGFADALPAIQTSITGLQIADTCFYYPEDRGLAESIRLGRRMAGDIARNSK